jgi:hypothetical protein
MYRGGREGALTRHKLTKVVGIQGAGVGHHESFLEQEDLKELPSDISLVPYQVLK